MLSFRRLGTSTARHASHAKTKRNAPLYYSLQQVQQTTSARTHAIDHSLFPPGAFRLRLSPSLFVQAQERANQGQPKNNKGWANGHARKSANGNCAIDLGRKHVVTRHRQPPAPSWLHCEMPDQGISSGGCFSPMPICITKQTLNRCSADPVTPVSRWCF